MIMTSSSRWCDDNDLIQPVVVLLTGSGCIGYSVSMLNVRRNLEVSTSLEGRPVESAEVISRWIAKSLETFVESLLSFSECRAYQPSEKLSGSPFPPG